VNSLPWRFRWKIWGSRTTTRAPNYWPRPWTPPRASCSTTARTPRPRPVSSTTAAASSTSPCIGRRNWLHKPRTRNWPNGLPPWPSSSARTRKPFLPSSTPCRASPSILAATTSPTSANSSKSCARAKPSTPPSTPSRLEGRGRAAPRGDATSPRLLRGACLERGSAQARARLDAFADKPALVHFQHKAHRLGGAVRVEALGLHVG